MYSMTMFHSAVVEVAFKMDYLQMFTNKSDKEKTCAGCYYLGYDSLGRAECIAGLDKQCACNGHVFWTKTDIIKKTWSNSMKFYQLIMTGNGKPIAVNFENVTFIHPCDDNEGTLIYFSGEKFVRVKESFDEISVMVTKILTR